MVKRTKKPATKNRHDKGVIDIIEEAIHLLRTSPLSALAYYYIGSLPFVLALFYFWTDMSRSAFAEERCAEAAFGLAIVFLWMKCWQSVFAQRLTASLHSVSPPRWSFRRIWHLATVQTILQPWGMLILPFSILLTAPFPWLYAFYQNVTVLGGGKNGHVKFVSQQAWRHATLWPKQNGLLIWLLSPWLLMCSAALLLVVLPLLSDAVLAVLIVFAFFALLLVMTLSPLGMIVAVNIAVTLVLIPGLLKTFFGIETLFTMSPRQMFHSTFFAVVCGLTYLCLDPLVKAVYVVRCFYGKALHTGEDLKVELRQTVLLRNQVISALILSICLLFAGNFPLWADDTPQIASQSSTLSAQELDRSLQQVLNQPEYTWRLPRENTGDTPDLPPPTFLKNIFKTLQGWGKAVGEWFSGVRDWFDKIGKWFKQLFPEKESEARGTGSNRSFGWSMKSQLLLYILLATIVCAAVILLWRAWKNHSRVIVDSFVDKQQPEPDLTDENVDASQLPPDDWLTLAQNLIEQGELRLSLRAFYLAGLAYLGEQRLVSIAKHKTDLDYEKELQRRAHALPALLALFLENMHIFQRSWYGRHDVRQDMLERVKTNYKKLKTIIGHTSRAESP